MASNSRGVGFILTQLDDGIFRTEKALVALASLVMTATVSLDIIQRAFARPDSKLGDKLLAFSSLVGVEQSSTNQAFFAQYVSPLVLGIVTIFAGWAAYGSLRRQMGRPVSKGTGLFVGCVGLGLAYGCVRVILVCPSRWMCFGLLTLGALTWCVQSIRILGTTKVLAALACALLSTVLATVSNLAVLGGLCYLAVFVWCVKTDIRLWSPVLAVMIVWAGWFGCAQLPPDTVTGGMQLGYVWSQELALILLAWVAFIGASMATRAGRHIQVDALSKVLPANLRPWTRAIGLGVSALFCAYLTALAYDHLFSQPAGDYWTGEVRPATKLPAWIIILSALVSFGLMTLRFSVMCVDAFIDRRDVEQELVH